MFIDLLTKVVFILNAFLHNNTIFKEVSSYTIMWGEVVDYNLHSKVAFGAYAQETRNLMTNDMHAHYRGHSNGTKF